jgi:S1-C subfamily serine protease
VYEVVADQPAYNNEIRTGDIIVAFNGRAVGTVDELHQLLNAQVIGRAVEMEVLRNGRINATLKGLFRGRITERSEG